MNFLNTLLAHLKTRTTSSDSITPQGFCPNCWGRQEYGGNFYDAVKNHTSDIDRIDPNLGWIQDYAHKHLKGIHLERQGENLICPHCKITYRPS